MQTLPEYLTKRYLAWQADEGERKTLEDYAKYLGVNRSLLSYWMNGSRVPSDENVKKLALNTPSANTSPAKPAIRVAGSALIFFQDSSNAPAVDPS